MPLFDPPSFITPHTEQAIAAKPGFAWDVVTAADLLGALNIADKMVANRWLYRRPDGVPPFEPTDIWKAGPGAPRVIRKDRAMAWAASGGKVLPGRACWRYAATDLAKVGWPDLSCPEAVQDVLDLLLGKGVVRLAYPLKDPSAFRSFYR